MKKITILIIALAVSACSDGLQKFTCTNDDGSKNQSSLKVGKGSATLNASSYPILCSTKGNLSVFGTDKTSCDNFKDGGNFTVLYFDNVIFRAQTSSKVLDDDSFTCKKID